MRHRLFAVVSILSLALCLTAAALWVRSYRVGENWIWRRPDGDRAVRTARGTFTLSWDLGFPTQVNGPQGLKYEQNPFACGVDPILFMCSDTGEIYAYWQRSGFCWIKKDRPRTGTYMARASAPMWSITAAWALLPLMWTTLQVGTRKLARKRGDLHLCRTCGYDLRATPDRCPECGAIPKKPKCIRGTDGGDQLDSLA